MQKKYQIAIDGPVAAGKGVVSKKLAEKLGFLYVDTGAMYRAAALLALRNEVDLEDEKGIVLLLKDSVIVMREPVENEVGIRLTTILLNGEDVTREIRKREVADAVAMVASHAEVRKELVKIQQEIAENNDVVMEGRDITSVVLPKADLKIYLNASEEVRVKRRWKDLQDRGVEMDLDDLREKIRKRDEMDKNRKTSPLIKLEDAWYVDASNMSIEEVVELIALRVNDMLNVNLN